MIKLVDLKLDEKHLAFLKKKQSIIDSITTYKEKIEVASKEWANTSKTTQAFTEAKRLLTQMCSGHLRCMFCEDSCSNEIEHFHPKSIYPEFTFDWDNFLYACGICNPLKNNKFAVFRTDNDAFQNVTPLHHKQRPQDYVLTPPPKGLPVLINPRKVDPFDYIELNLSDFRFVPIETNQKTKEIAEFTINTALKLNRPVLCKARKTAFKTFRALLSEYHINKVKASSSNLEEETKKTIFESPHITVWYEMKRWYQSESYKRQFLKVNYPNVFQLFKDNPEVLDW